MSRFVLLNEAGAVSEGLDVVRWVVQAGAPGGVHMARAQGDWSQPDSVTMNIPSLFKQPAEETVILKTGKGLL